MMITPIIIIMLATITTMTSVIVIVIAIAIPGSSKKTAILSNSLRRNLHAPFPPIQCCYIALLRKAFKQKQPFRFGCRHALGNNIDQGGAGGSGVMWQHVGGRLFFLKNPGKIFWQLEPIPFCTCQNLNPSTLAASKLLPTKQRRNRFVFFRLWMCKRKLENKFPFARAKTPIQTHFHLQSCYPQTKKQHCSICSACGQKLEIRAVCLAWCTNVECACTPPEAELQRSADKNIRGHKHRFCTVHVQCTLQCTSQCTATKRCKYHVCSQK